MHIKGIKETCLYINDIEQTAYFYHRILGLEIYNKIDGKLIFFRAGESMLLCFLNGTTENQSKLPPHYAKGNIHFAFEVHNSEYENWKNYLKNSGIKIEFEQQWKNELMSFYFRDPDMNLVEILMEGVWDH
jgi:catechol 2,3-dioxygenase-like lactoylglutathione lyase family enzyme